MRVFACHAIRGEKKLENRIGLPRYVLFEVPVAVQPQQLLFIYVEAEASPAQFTQPSVNYESNFHICPAAARMQNSGELVKGRSVRDVRVISLFALARSIGAPVFPTCRFFSFVFLRTSREREHFLPADRRRPRLPFFLLFFRYGRPARVTRGGTRQFRLIVHRPISIASSLSLFLTLSFSPNGTAPVDLNEFFPFGTRRLLLPFSRSAGQPSLVSLEIFYPMNSCGSSGKSGRSIVSIVGRSPVRRKRLIVKFGSILRNCLICCLSSEFCMLQQNFYKRTIIKYIV